MKILMGPSNQDKYKRILQVLYWRILAWIMTVGIVASPRSVYAQLGLQEGLDFAKGTSTSGGLRFRYITTILGGIILFLLSLIAVLGLGALISGGIMYIISFGDENRTQRAKRIILYGIIGIVVALTSFVIIAVIRTIFT